MNKTPADAPSGEDQNPRRIQAMFEQISPSYDRLNHLLSGQLDKYWRRVTARRLTANLQSGSRVLDIATGTGDLAWQLQKAPAVARVIGLDFTGAMVRRAAVKYGTEKCCWVEGDGLRLPFIGESFAACSIAFGLRNMADRTSALREMHRILKPGGRVAILEFSQPGNPLMRRMYDFYSFTVMPRLGKWISGSDAYLYLPQSIRLFPGPDALADQMRQVGFGDIYYKKFMGGVVVLHLATCVK